MSGKFRDVNRDQQFLLPPNLKNWLPEDHLVFFLLDAAETLDLSPFYENYNQEFRGEKAYSPKVLVPLLLYAYIDGVRSSREIEKRAQEDVAYRIAASNQQPDHSTICRFRKQNRTAFQDLFLEVLKLCDDAGMVEVGTISLDGTKMKASASFQANKTYKNIRREIEEILNEAEEIDREEDEKYGKENRGDELPEELADRESRLKRLRECKENIEREARQEAEEKRKEIEQRKKEERETGRKKRGRKPDPPDPTPDEEEDRGNPTDPESQIMVDRRGFLQGYNLQAAVGENQIILAAEATNDAVDHGQLRPMIEKTEKNLKEAQIVEENEEQEEEKEKEEEKETGFETVVADNGYWNEETIKEIEEEKQLEVLVATEKGAKLRKKFREETEDAPKPNPEEMDFQELMECRLLQEDGQKKYRKRARTVEPVFGQIKEQQRCDRLRLRRVKNVDTEWKLMAIGHNLTKLWRKTWKN